MQCTIAFSMEKAERKKSTLNWNLLLLFRRHRRRTDTSSLMENIFVGW